MEDVPPEPTHRMGREGASRSATATTLHLSRPAATRPVAGTAPEVVHRRRHQVDAADGDRLRQPELEVAHALAAEVAAEARHGRLAHVGARRNLGDCRLRGEIEILQHERGQPAVGLRALLGHHLQARDDVRDLRHRARPLVLSKRWAFAGSTDTGRRSPGFTAMRSWNTALTFSPAIEP